MTNQLDLFEHSRDVMLHNDVLAALEQRNAAAGREALRRLAAEYPADALVPTLEILVRVLEYRVHEHITCHTAEDDFEAAANRLVTEQVLYAADRGSKVAYGLIRDFEREFKRALEPLGYVVRVNSQLRYACAIPKHARTSPVTVDQTLLALVLRKIFDEETRSGHHDENGEVACDLVAASWPPAASLSS